MTLAGAPNDIIQNLNPISIIIMIPILDHGIYPGLRKMGVNLSPIRRMTVGYFFATAAMVAAAVMQHYIYQTSSCGYHASDEGCVSPIIVWAQCVPVSIFLPCQAGPRTLEPGSREPQPDSFADIDPSTSSSVSPSSSPMSPRTSTPSPRPPRT